MSIYLHGGLQGYFDRETLHETVVELFDPATFHGAALYAVVFGLAAWVAGRAVRLAVHRTLDSHVPRADPTAVTFLGQLARLGIYIFAILSYFYHIPSLRQLGGVWLTSVGVVSVVVGIAAQSTLSNLISGVSLLLYRPFRLGDRLQVTALSNVESGVVESLSLGYTTLETDDKRKIIIPARDEHATAVVTVILAPSADVQKARAILNDLAAAHEKAASVASCRVTAITDSGITLALTVWCADAATAAEVKSDLLESAKKRFDAEGVAIAH
jgi:small-conductance mechanosensitive channel